MYLHLNFLILALNLKSRYSFEIQTRILLPRVSEMTKNITHILKMRTLELVIFYPSPEFKIFLKRSYSIETYLLLIFNSFLKAPLKPKIQYYFAGQL